MKIAMIGAGYVGLVSGACLADFGHEVVCVDNNPERVASLGRGEIPIYEPGLAALVKANEAAGRLRFTGVLAEAMAGAAAVFIAVGTPSRHGDGHADLSYVYAAAREIVAHLSGFVVIIDKSTVPVGTGDEVERILREANPGADFAVVSNPEFLREGAAIEDFTHPDRIVIGTEDERARAVMAEIYRPLALNQAPLMFTSRRSAELIKYAGNAFLAMKITFINEIADLAEAAGANVQDVARGIGADNRIGGKFLNAGPGYGGSCFPKDTQALVRTAHELGRPVRLIETTTAINAERHTVMTRKIVAACGGSVKAKRIGILGLTFKPNTDDMREAPSLAIIADLREQGAEIVAYDPEGMDAARPMLPGIAFGSGPYDIAQGADALVLITEWTAFRSLDLPRLRAAMRTPLFIDLRNVYRRAEMQRAGLRYRSVGRPTEDIE
jgi:UDPglucose 6-dehydrogenase